MNIKGFTLIELSIVLIIIAMGIGGVLVGQDLIRSAELNSFTKDIQRFNSAIEGFKSQYNNLPGDMDNAFDYFDTNCATTSGACNGDGDSKIGRSETYKAWKHLDESNYIKDAMEKVGTTSLCTIGVNVPVTAIDPVSAAFRFDYGDSDYDSRTARSATVPLPGQLMSLGRALTSLSVTNCASGNSTSAFTSNQMYRIDLKIDDGLAYDGRVLSSENAVGCTTSTGNSDDGEYDLENSGDSLCRLYYRIKADY